MTKPPKNASHRGVGTSRFRLEPVRSGRLDFSATTTCVLCGGEIVVPFGNIMATFRIGQEFVGLVCDGCLSPQTQADLARLRVEQD